MLTFSTPPGRLFLPTLAAVAIAQLCAIPIPARAQMIPSDAKPTCIVSSAMFASWFESGAPSQNGVVKPANSVTFPNTPNCSFYQWSMQMFLWLTSPAPPRYGGGGGRILDSPTFYDVSPPDANGDRTFIPHTPGIIRAFNLRAAQVGPRGLPIVFDRRGRMLEVERNRLSPAGRPLILNRAGRTVEVARVELRANRPVFLDLAGRTIATPKALVRPQLSKTRTVQRFMIGQRAVFLDPFGNVIDVDQGQAGGGEVLQAQNGSLVYFVTMVNDVYAYFLTGAKNGGITPAPTKFPTTQTDLNKVITFAAAHGKTFPDPEALAVEVKSAWVEATGLQSLSSYLTMQAVIPTYDTSNPAQWTQNGQKTTQLALVGIHVVGSTAGHPEMIWATFERFGNAPNAAFAYIKANNATTTVPQNTAGTWLFAANNATSPFNCARMQYNPPNIDAVSDPGCPSNTTIGPSNTIRWKAWGGASDFSPNPLDPTSAASNTEIISINSSVLGMVPVSDVRANYYMTGSTWTIGGASPTGSFKSGVGGNEVGTSKMANTTMETYQQGSNSLWSTGSNCFSCHHANTTSVSHMFGPLKPLFP